MGTKTKNYFSKFMPRIKKVLEAKPGLRENKNLVVMQIIWEQMRLYNQHYPEFAVLSAKDLIKFMAKQKPHSRKYMPNIEGLYRAARKVKELHPELYGKADQQRHRMQEQVRQEAKDSKKNANLPGEQTELF